MTKKLSDMATDLLDTLRKKSGEAVEKSGEVLTDAYDVVVDTAIEGAARTKKAFSRPRKPKSPKATAEGVPEATPEVAPKAQRKRVTSVKTVAGKPDVTSKAKHKPVVKAKAEIAPKVKAGIVAKAKAKPASPSRAGNPKLA